MIELRQLNYFVAVAEELHFARAAERLHIAQPALSMQIKALEQQLAVRLLERSKRSVALTAAGALFLDEARLTLRQARHAEEVGRQASRAELGPHRRRLQQLRAVHRRTVDDPARVPCSPSECRVDPQRTDCAAAE
ncbi:MAG: LysR family transcriptional regulator [Aliidongia sp.]